MIAFALSALLTLAAQDANAPAHVGDWLVGPLESADRCQMEARFGDHYLLNISEDSTGNGSLIFADDRLLLKDGDKKPATYSWDGWNTTRQGEFTVLKAPSGAFFLAMDTSSAFTEEMAGAKGLSLRILGVGFDNNFEIPNAHDLVTAVAVCNSKL